MAVNDFCRLCEVNLCIHGLISASKLIFDSRETRKYVQPTVKVRISSVKLFSVVFVHFESVGNAAT